MAALMTAMGLAGPMALKMIGMIAGKALILSKVALTIAGMIALKKLYSDDHHEETSFQVHAASEHNRRNSYATRPIKSVAPATTAPIAQQPDPYRFYNNNNNNYYDYQSGSQNTPY